MKWVYILGLLVLAGCSGSATMEAVQSSGTGSYTGDPFEEFLVMVLLEDANANTRLAMERNVVQQLRAEGIAAQAGYTLFDSLDDLVANPESFEPELEQAGVKAVLFLDPEQIDTDYDPGEYAQARSAYRALGFDTSASINLIRQLAAESEAAKVIMTAAVWRPGDDDDLWQTTYDINAPGSYDPEVAREYAKTFATEISATLKSEGIAR